MNKKDEKIRKELNKHGDCPNGNPPKCEGAMLAKISGTNVIVCFRCLKVIPEKNKIDNVEKEFPFSWDMLYPTSR